MTDAGFEPDLIDASCIGETMVSFVATEDPRIYAAIAAGAESNVAVGMARLGCRTRWVSRVGDDALGRLVEDAVGSSGVDVSVERDPDLPTGVMVKHPAGSEKVSSYYRSQSAARLLGPSDVGRIGTATWVHVTGITPALSPSAHQLVAEIVSEHTARAGGVSFDVNLRERLWPSRVAAADTLLPLARGADVVFIGDDEADALFGTTSVTALADLFDRVDDRTLVVKHGAEGATAVTDEGQAFVPALRTSVVDVTGAGDAFAAGYLAAAIRGWNATGRLRLGHALAALVVGHPEDVPPMITDAEAAGFTETALASRWDQHADEPSAPTDDVTARFPSRIEPSEEKST